MIFMWPEVLGNKLIFSIKGEQEIKSHNFTEYKAEVQ